LTPRRRSIVQSTAVVRGAAYPLRIAAAHRRPLRRDLAEWTIASLNYRPKESLGPPITRPSTQIALDRPAGWPSHARIHTCCTVQRYVGTVPPPRLHPGVCGGLLGGRDMTFASSESRPCPLPVRAPQRDQGMRNHQQFSGCPFEVIIPHEPRRRANGRASVIISSSIISLRTSLVPPRRAGDALDAAGTHPQQPCPWFWGFRGGRDEAVFARSRRHGALSQVAPSVLS
jgi:hypothetical protein